MGHGSLDNDLRAALSRGTGHYDSIKSGLRSLDDVLRAIPTPGAVNTAPLDRDAPAAVILISSFNGLGVHTILSALRFFPGLYRQFIFVSIAVVDSGHFKGREEIEARSARRKKTCRKYVDLRRRSSQGSWCSAGAFLQSPAAQ